MMHRLQQEIFRRHEIGVEDSDELALRRLHARLQSASLEALAMGAVMISNSVSQGGIALDHRLRHFDGLVGGIVEQLDVQLVARVIEAANRLHQPVDHELLVEDGQLHRDPRQFFKAGRRLLHLVLAVSVIEVHKHIAMHAVSRQQDENHEVGDQQRQVKGVDLVDALEPGIGQVLVLGLQESTLNQRSRYEDDGRANVQSKLLSGIHAHNSTRLRGGDSPQAGWEAWLDWATLPRMLFMVIERFRHGNAQAIGNRFKQSGRMLPEGVAYHASWVDVTGSRCFQIMEAPGLESLKLWIERWHDLVDFEVVPVLTSAEFWAKMPAD
jgi:Protein of unknown function (DUF3303)